jgi:TnpA family transposase
MKRQWTRDELGDHWTLSPKELELVANKSGATRLGFAVLLKAFTLEGRFPGQKHDIPGAVIVHVGNQINVPADLYPRYEWSGRTIEYHRAQIREFLGFREATVQDGNELVTWLVQQVLPHDHREEHVGEAVFGRCRALRIEPPSIGRIDRLVRSALHSFEERWCASVLERLDAATQRALDDLLMTGSADDDRDAEATETRRSGLNELKADAGAISLESVLAETAKLERLRNLGLPTDLFRDVSLKVVERFRQRAAAEAPNELRAHAPALRATLVASLCWLRQREVTDSLVDLLIQVIHKINMRAEKRVEKELLDDLKRVTGKVSVLFHIAEASVEQPDGRVRDVVFPAAGGEQKLRDLVREYKSSGPAFRFQVHTYLRASYASHYRRMVPQLLQALEFRSNNAAHRPLIEALELLKRYANSSQRLNPAREKVPLQGVVPPAIEELVVHKDAKGKGRVDRINYEICVLRELRERLRCKEIWVVGADRYRNPDEDLPQDFDAKRDDYYAEIDQPRDVEAFIADLQQTMRAALDTLDHGLPRNPSVKIQPNGRIVVSPLIALPEPVHLSGLKDELVVRWPMTSLLDILKETDLRVGITRHFASLTSHEALDPATLQRRLLLCLYGLGTNAGLKRIANGNHGENVADIRYVFRRYVRKEPLRQAIADVVNATFRARRPDIWGEGTTACASDSKKFGVWDQNLLTEWHIRYRGPGIMIFWHVERGAVCVYSQLKSCSSSEVAAMMEGVLRHCTEMTVERQYVDSHGQSEIGFAFSQLLGFQLLPRLKSIARQKLYRPDTGAPDAYHGLQPVLTRPIRWDLIRQQYDEMIKYATALRLGTADAESILRRFTRDAPQHPTYQALAELGKAVKTIFLCRYLHLEALRREIHEGLNVVENWNSANGFIFYGKGGEISTNRRDEQELAVLSLHLLQSSLVYINTLMLQHVLREPVWIASMTTDDLRGLTPLIYTHVNPYGTFSLDLAERLELDPDEVAA